PRNENYIVPIIKHIIPTRLSHLIHKLHGFNFNRCVEVMIPTLILYENSHFFFLLNFGNLSDGVSKISSNPSTARLITSAFPTFLTFLFPFPNFPFTLSTTPSYQLPPPLVNTS